MGDQDEIQNLRINNLEGQVKDNTQAIGELRESVSGISAGITTQNATLQEIKEGTAGLGKDFRDELRSMREAQAQERREEREAAAREAKEKRDARSAWWSSIFKLVGTLLPILGGLAGGGYYYAQSQSVDKPAPAATEKP